MKTGSTKTLSVLHINHSDIRGGAAKSAYRLHSGLRAIGIDSQMSVVDSRLQPRPQHIQLVGNRLGRCLSKFLKNLEIYIPKFASRHLRESGEIFDVGRFGRNVHTHIRQSNPDIINLHWINWGTLQIASLAECDIPVIWTLHDMWPMTGGCHYAGTCEGFTESCGFCPLLGSKSESDLSSRTLRLKHRNWPVGKLHFIAPSQWMADQVNRSSLFRNCPVSVIPYGIDSQVFHPSARNSIRDDSRLKSSKFLILFCSGEALLNPRKGFSFLLEALAELKNRGMDMDAIEVQCAGAEQHEINFEAPCLISAMGQIQSETDMAALYANADLFVAPSLEDNLPNTVLESLACGTPVAAFNLGGMPDMIHHRNNGYLATAIDPRSLADGIEWSFNLPKTSFESAKLAARQTVEDRFTLEVQATAYRRLYEEILRAAR